MISMNKQLKIQLKKIESLIGEKDLITMIFFIEKQLEHLNGNKVNKMKIEFNNSQVGEYTFPEKFIF